MSKLQAALVAVTLIVTAVVMFGGKFSAAQEDNSIAALSKKIDSVMNNQKAILQDLALIKEEINVVKIRVTQIQ